MPVVDAFPLDDIVPGAEAGVGYYKRLAPIAVEDHKFGWTLRKIALAIMRPGEIFQSLARDSDTHSAWGKALDPDYAPAPLLRWLALFPGVRLQPGDTESQRRYRINQAAGFYRGTPRAVVEELQLVLTGTKTVLLGFHTPDQWHYMVGTIDTETPDTAAVLRAVRAQKPKGTIVEVVTTDDWSSFVLAPSLVAHRELVDGVDSYVIGAPMYPTCQSVLDSFATCQDLLDNNPI